jgi:uridine phosphorylase
MRAGAVAVEMELATLLVMAGLRGLRAGGIFCVDGNLARKTQPAVDPESYDPHHERVRRGVDCMLGIALQALVRLPET